MVEEGCWLVPWKAAINFLYQESRCFLVERQSIVVGVVPGYVKKFIENWFHDGFRSKKEFMLIITFTCVGVESHIGVE